jgi:diguanylate cyclase (GGDEF)-like protein
MTRSAVTITQSALSQALSPGRHLLGHARLVQKFALVGLLLLIPVSWLAFGYYSNAADEHQFTADERSGLTIQVAAIDVFAELIALRAGDGDQAQLSQMVERLNRVVTSSPLAGQVDEPWRTTVRAINDPRLDAPLPATRVDVASEAISALERFIIVVGDRSNLTLDPELDSYYLMDAVQYRYPLLIDLAEQITRLDLATASAGSSQQSGLRREVARLMNRELQALSLGLETAERETNDATIAAAIGPRSSVAASAAAAIDDALEAAQSNERDVTEALRVVTDTDLLIDGWRLSAADLDVLLRQRLAAMNSERDRFTVVAVVCAALAGYLLLSLFSGLLRPLRDIRSTLHQVGLGSLNERITPEGNDELSEVAIAINDTVSKVAAARAELEYRATYDELTGLLNRHRFIELLDEHLRGHRHGNETAVCFIDLDRFKAVNDLYGHRTGDNVLRVVADRLKSAVGTSAIPCRLAGDEFALLIPASPSRSLARELADRIRTAMADPIVLTDHDTTKIAMDGASIGIAYYDGSTPMTADELLAAADLAMYDAKNATTGSVREFTDELATIVRRRLRLRSDLSFALDSPEPWGLTAAYQPIVGMADRSFIGGEALARWNHPDLGPISPVDFIPVAEQAGMVGRLGEHVLATAAGHLGQWKTSAPNLHLSVNVSAHQLVDNHLEHILGDVLAINGLVAADVWLELTESAVMDDPQAAAAAIHRLAALGHHISIDDFGTGYSSLAYLQRLRATALKIDRSFVNDLDHADPRASRHILEAMVNLAHHLDLSVIAEGIETEDQFTTLQALGVDAAQGFLISRPLTPDNFTHALGAHLSADR